MIGAAAVRCAPPWALAQPYFFYIVKNLFISYTEFYEIKI